MKRLTHFLGFYISYDVHIMEPTFIPETGMYDYPIALHRKIYKAFYITIYKKKVQL
jgi:hypothetical protein